ncbi:unnamed protein product, partial [Chrysoparadoxa australica]
MRKDLRVGWTKPNAFHVCITSYQLAVQDASSFKRKKWYHLILDEAHNIKNFKSQRWQVLLTFNSQRRLLLTGTPLQNNLMELWSLMHFLMPHIFRSRREFSYWFSNPLSSMVEGSRNVNSDLISRLHSIMRPFLLRRLKKEVAKQLPGKFEHVVMCPLSRRQQQLYEEFMSRSITRAAMSGGNFMGMMNVLMQLRKVCNHPDLFEPRPITSPFVLRPLSCRPGTLTIRIAREGVSSSLLTCLWPDPVTADGALFSQEQAASLKSLWPKPGALLHVTDLNICGAVAVPDPASLDLVAMNLGDIVLGGLARIRQGVIAEARGQRQLMEQLNNQRLGRAAEEHYLSWRKVMAVRLPSTADPLLHAALAQQKGGERLRRMCPLTTMGLVKGYEARCEEMRPVVELACFSVPQVIAHEPQLIVARPDQFKEMREQQQRRDLLEEVKRRGGLDMIYPAAVRMKINFPDRKLVQFDSGKLQVLAGMLRKLKLEGHKCLIFTQMTKMLNVLEEFLNIHGMTYVRLDGSTGVEKRQRLMDRFNGDPKIFCFILSTRSGGLGINLTGADTVIFYDSDWNPAMDAQAQDRAHRIGQTRDVHIYRLVTASTVEENILRKAKQKRHLDFLVMTEGNFTADYLSTGGLKDILRTEEAKEADQDQASEPSNGKGGAASHSAAEIQAAMNSLEDDDDVAAGRALQKEAADEAMEFADDAPTPQEEAADSDDEEKPQGKGRGAKQKGKAKGKGGAVKQEEADGAEDEKGAGSDAELEKEFAAWQSNVGLDSAKLEASLLPIERYGLRFKETHDPFYSLYYLTEQQRKQEAEAETDASTWDVEAIEEEREVEERRQMESGELLAAHVQHDMVPKQRSLFCRERAKAIARKKRRDLTGAAWRQRKQEADGLLYWYNDDTKEAVWDAPRVICDNEARKTAYKLGYSGMPRAIMLVVMSYIDVFPDRLQAGLVCRSWRAAAADVSFQLRVLPVEAGLREAGAKAQKLGSGCFSSVAAAVAAAQAGDTIVLGTGHHWEENILVTKPMRLIGEWGDSSRVIVEITGQLSWVARNGTLFGMTLRRPRRTGHQGPLAACRGSKLQLANCVVTNEEGCDGRPAVLVEGVGALMAVTNSQVLGSAGPGIEARCCGNVVLSHAKVKNCHGSGVVVSSGSTAIISDSFISDNRGLGVKVCEGGTARLEHNDCSSNVGGPLEVATPGSVASLNNRCLALPERWSTGPPLGFSVGAASAVPEAVKQVRVVGRYASARVVGRPQQARVVGQQQQARVVGQQQQQQARVVGQQQQHQQARVVGQQQQHQQARVVGQQQ